ncbi:MAG TPA: hypothetical protein VGM56_32470 [Byssovorax sp.]|jgi:hypothetical protein
MTRLAFVAFALTSALASGCAADDAPADARVASVGVVAGSDAVVGAVAEAGAFTLYICGGSAARERRDRHGGEEHLHGVTRRRACGNAAK